MDPVQRNLVRRLCREADIPEERAVSLVRDRGSCAYCGRDLLVDRLGYATARVDRLLPRSSYPECADVEDNWVLGCSLCIGTKRDWDPLDPDEKKDATGVLRDQRPELIRRATCYIEVRRMDAGDREWLAVRRVLLARSRAQAGTPRLKVVSAEPPDSV